MKTQTTTYTEAAREFRNARVVTVLVFLMIKNCIRAIFSNKNKYIDQHVLNFRILKL